MNSPSDWNNDAKDVIGRLRAIFLLLILQRTRTPHFPLDDALRSWLQILRPQFVEMIDIVAELGSFGSSRAELLSCIDDIVDATSTTYYTQDHFERLLSIFADSEIVIRPNYDDEATFKQALRDICIKNMTKLLDSLLWLRIGFFSLEPMTEIAPLKEMWL
jgi:hypothetical protein